MGIALICCWNQRYYPKFMIDIISRTKYLSFLWVPKHSWLKLLCLMILMFCIFLMCVIDFLIKSWRNHMMGEQNYICNMYNIDLTLCIAAKRLNTSMLFVSLSCFIKWPLPRDTWVEFCYHIALSIHDWSNPGGFCSQGIKHSGLPSFHKFWMLYLGMYFLECNQTSKSRMTR